MCVEDRDGVGRHGWVSKQLIGPGHGYLTMQQPVIQGDHAFLVCPVGSVYAHCLAFLLVSSTFRSQNI